MGSLECLGIGRTNFFFFWINKNLFQKGKTQQKNTQEARSPQKSRKTDSTSPKSREKGHQPEHKKHLINKPKPTYGHNQHKQQANPTARDKLTKTKNNKPTTRAQEKTTKEQPTTGAKSTRDHPTESSPHQCKRPSTTRIVSARAKDRERERPPLTPSSVCMIITNFLHS